jgi:hypothetical protein
MRSVRSCPASDGRLGDIDAELADDGGEVRAPQALGGGRRRGYAAAAAGRREHDEREG